MRRAESIRRRVGTDARRFAIREPDGCHTHPDAQTVAAPATVAPPATRPRSLRIRRKSPAAPPPGRHAHSRPQPHAPQPLFDFSTNYPQGKSKVYPQKPFMLRCYFLARLGPAGPTSPYRNGSQDTGRGAKVSVTVGREDRASAGSELRNARNAGGSWNVSGREASEGGERAGAGSWKVFGPEAAVGVLRNRSQLVGRPGNGRSDQEGVRGAARHVRRPRLSTWRLFGFRAAQTKRDPPACRGSRPHQKCIPRL